MVNGVLELDVSIINNHIIDYFSTLFSSASSPRDLLGIKEVIPHLVSDADNAMLMMMPSHNLNRSVVFDMDPYNTLGPDRFIGHLFRSCWNIVGFDLCKCSS